jgi:DNA topoisomerase-6 subunit B
MADQIAARTAEDHRTQLELTFKTPQNAAKKTTPRPKRSSKSRTAAEKMAEQQREISVSEFFAKNRHLLGFDNPRKALLTTVKEAVDNALDACEEAGALPDLLIEIHQITEDRFRVAVQDNGPGIVKAQIPNIFGKLLYGSKFHRLKMSRGQQGIGISAAGMYGLLTTGRSIRITSRTQPRAAAHYYEIQIDTRKNRPDVIKDEEVEFELDQGTRVEIDLVARYNKGRSSVDAYLEQTSIANPHAHIRYRSPTGERVEFKRASEQLPPETRQIKPHPYGIEMGVLLKMLKDSKNRTLAAFMKDEFCRVSATVAEAICKKAGLSPNSKPARIGRHEVETLYQAIQDTKIMAPPTDCVAPIGTRQILDGLEGIKAEFYTASTRSPSVYRGNPFQVEVGLAYGGDLPGDELARVIRFANRVPLLYQQSSCAMFKSVADMNWRGYGLSQGRSALPQGPLVVMVHLASVWAPFTSESKEAIADYDEIRKELRLALQDCGRKLQAYIRRRARTVRENQRRGVFERYIGELVESVGKITRVDRDRMRRDLLAMATQKTERADEVLDEDGRPIERQSAEASLSNGQDTVVVERTAREGAPKTLFDDDAPTVASGRRAS